MEPAIPHHAPSHRPTVVPSILPVHPAPLPVPTPSSRNRDWPLAFARLAIFANALSLLAWLVAMTVGKGFLLLAMRSPTWDAVVVTWYPAHAIPCGLVAIVVALRTRRVEPWSLGALWPTGVALLPLALAAVAIWSGGYQRPLSNRDFATRAERRLALAAYTGDLPALERALREGVSPDTTAVSGPSILELSIQGNQFAAFERLLQAGASPEGRGSQSAYAAPRALVAANSVLTPPRARWLSRLLDRGLPADWGADGYDTALLLEFAELDDEEAVRLLLARGADPAIRTRRGELTPFCRSVGQGKFGAALALLDRAPPDDLECAAARIEGAPLSHGEAAMRFRAAFQPRLDAARNEEAERRWRGAEPAVSSAPSPQPSPPACERELNAVSLAAPPP